MSGVNVAVLNTTRGEVAIKLMGDIAEELRRFEAQGERLFTEYVAAQARCKEEGLVIDFEMGAGPAAWFSEFKQRAARDEARRLVAEERL